MKTVAFLWWEDEIDWSKDRPFGDKKWKNRDYAEYTEMLKERDVKVLCGDYRWYTGGELEKAFHWDGEDWKKVEDVGLDGVYDLFRHSKQKYRLKKKMQEEVQVFNDPEVAELCQDKLETYRNFSEHMPETLTASKQSTQKILESASRAVLKPRYGSSGEGIEIVEKVPERIDEDMLVQEFMESDNLPEFGIEGPHDLRVLVVSGEPIGSYFRVPGEGLLSNVALGGNKIYVETDSLGQRIFEIVEEVDEKLESYNPSVYTVDFMYSDGRPWIVELNSQPGVYYHGEGREEEWERPWMERIADAIAEKLQA
ncbi:MAG: RimK family alpha-L-glutamate ligase [Candidatus Nanohaloarchaea archaeon]